MDQNRGWSRTVVSFLGNIWPGNETTVAEQEYCDVLSYHNYYYNPPLEEVASSPGLLNFFFTPQFLVHNNIQPEGVGHG